MPNAVGLPARQRRLRLMRVQPRRKRTRARAADPAVRTRAQGALHTRMDRQTARTAAKDTDAEAARAGPFSVAPKPKPTAVRHRKKVAGTAPNTRTRTRQTTTRHRNAPTKPRRERAQAEIIRKKAPPTRPVIPALAVKRAGILGAADDVRVHLKRLSAQNVIPA